MSLHKKLLELAKPYLEKNDLGVAHTLRVLNVARKHFGIPGEIEEQVYALIILHDIGGSSVKDQYEKGPEIATKLLKQVGHNNEVIDSICESIRAHHERIKGPPEPFKILYDADHLVMFSRKEFNYYNSKPGFDWESVINNFYFSNSKKLAEKWLKERKGEDGEKKNH